MEFLGRMIFLGLGMGPPLPPSPPPPPHPPIPDDWGIMEFLGKMIFLGLAMGPPPAHPPPWRLLRKQGTVRFRSPPYAPRARSSSFGPTRKAAPDTFSAPPTQSPSSTSAMLGAAGTETSRCSLGACASSGTRKRRPRPRRLLPRGERGGSPLLSSRAPVFHADGAKGPGGGAVRGAAAGRA